MLFGSLLLLTFISTVYNQNCRSWSLNFNEYLGTKTPYRLIANSNVSEIIYKGCKATKIWMAVRHGTRSPSSKQISDMDDVLSLLKDNILNSYKNNTCTLCADAAERFMKWTPINWDGNKNLLPEGKREMQLLGYRFQKRFPTLFPDYSKTIYQLRSTEKQRAIGSLRNFLVGFLGEKKVSSVWPVGDHKLSKVTRFYKLCPRWIRDVDKNPLSLLERKKFEDSSYWWDQAKALSKSLGLDYVLPQSTIVLMYKTCGFETAGTPNLLSPWCSVFNDDFLATLEYGEDLENYYVDGYGHPLNYLQACPAVSDLIQHFNSKQDPQTSLSFSHSGTMLKLLSHFGLYNETVKHDNMDLNRKWRVGKIDAFGSNLAFVKFQCSDEEKFLVLHQERQVALPGCPTEGLCPMKVLIDSHGGSLKNCRFEEMCRIPEHHEF